MSQEKESMEFKVGLILGKVEGIETGLSDIKDGQKSMDKRLRAIEVRSGVYGTIAGAVSGFATIIFGGNSGV